jgi:hypothetical protein
MAKRVRLPKAESESFWRRQINEPVVRLLAARGCELASRCLVGRVPGISPVLVAVAGRTKAAVPKS